MDRAARFLALADEANLVHLKAIALDFIFHNFPDVAASPGAAAFKEMKSVQVLHFYLRKSKNHAGYDDKHSNGLSLQIHVCQSESPAAAQSVPPH